MSTDIPLPPPEPAPGQAAIKEYSDPSPTTPVQPVQLGPDDTFQFSCHKGIACFNKCCQNIDIMLAPYDILRLKKRLGISSRDFIDNFTRDYSMDGHGMPGLKLATKDESPACVFLRPEGCGVYEDRPSACRYYALGLLSMRKKDSPTDEDSYFVVKEDHCLGHQEPKTQTVRDYRKEQGLEDYDAINREWRQIVLKKRSSGPTIGKPSERSMELFYLASYNLDGFRDFISTAGFAELFVLDPAEKDDAAGERRGAAALCFPLPQAGAVRGDHHSDTSRRGGKAARALPPASGADGARGRRAQDYGSGRAVRKPEAREPG